LLLKNLIGVCVFLILAVSAASDNALPSGVVEGHVKIISLKEVELADADVSTKATSVNYSEYPLIIRSRDGVKEISRVTADAEGNYRLALPPGDYILDVEGRAPKRLRATRRPFTVLPNQTVRVDMDIDTGIR
jgi:hypothetical protein